MARYSRHVAQRKKVVKLGMKTEQRDGFEYEFTCVLDIVHDNHYAVASKDRTGLFTSDALVINEYTGKSLLAWLESGAEPKPVVLDPKPWKMDEYQELHTQQTSTSQSPSLDTNRPNLVTHKQTQFQAWI